MLVGYLCHGILMGLNRTDVMIPPTLLINGPKDSRYTVVLAHGAGAPMDSPFMETVCCALAEQGLRTVRFEFPYMAKRRTDGKKRGPDQTKVLLCTWNSVIAQFDTEHLIIGGKSMGGRMATMVANDSGVRAVVCLGYPFHPPGKPDRTRLESLCQLDCPVLVVQGTRDPFGGPCEVSGYPLPTNIDIRWVEDGEHSYIPRKKSGRTVSQNLDCAVGAMMTFINFLDAP